MISAKSFVVSSESTTTFLNVSKSNVSNFRSVLARTVAILRASVSIPINFATFNDIETVSGSALLKHVQASPFSQGLQLR